MYILTDCIVWHTLWPSWLSWFVPLGQLKRVHCTLLWCTQTVQLTVLIKLEALVDFTFIFLYLHFSVRGFSFHFIEWSTGDFHCLNAEKLYEAKRRHSFKQLDRTFYSSLGILTMTSSYKGWTPSQQHSSTKSDVGSSDFYKWGNELNYQRNLLD